jgi:hypothetical protein
VLTIERERVYENSLIELVKRMLLNVREKNMAKGEATLPTDFQ